MKCAYPPCPIVIESGGDNPPIFCEKHQAQKCVRPKCQDTVIPNSGFCQVHNDLAICFDFLHQDRHMKAMGAMQEAQRNAVIMEQVRNKGNGKDGGLIRGRP